MTLHIDDPEAERLARQLADETGESITEAVVQALRDRLASARSRRERQEPLSEVAEIQVFVASLPVRDDRPPDEILGYDEYGLPR